MTLSGHAIEVRLYAEDPTSGLLATNGEKYYVGSLRRLPNVRIDHGMLEAGEISPFYDPMVAKVIAYGKTREDAYSLIGACSR